MSSRKYIYDQENDIRYVYDENGDLDNLIEDNVYEVDEDEYYIYRGMTKSSDAHYPSGSMILNSKTRELEVIGQPYTQADLKTKKEIDLLKSINENMKELSGMQVETKIAQAISGPVRRKKRSESKIDEDDEEETPKKKRHRSKNMSSKDSKINLEIEDEDGRLVRIIKEKLNNGNYTLSDVYDFYVSIGYIKNDAWNLYYGLKTRHTMKWESFEAWCLFFNETVELVFKPIK